jgi:uncharacterized protein
MIRIAIVGGRLEPDPDRRAPGRGAYLHRDPRCLVAFISRKPFLRSLRAPVARAERERLVAQLG